MQTHREDNKPPEVVELLGWRYHHVGIPTDIAHSDERYLVQYGMYVSGFETSRYGVEWMRFDKDSPLPEIIRRIPHVAFEVNDIEAALIGREIIWPLGGPSDGVQSAMIIDNGALIELISFSKNV
jgi:hypothetical protein